MPSEPLNVNYFGLGLKWAKQPIIGDNVRMTGMTGFFDCQDQITIGDNCFIGHEVKILTGYHDYTKFDLERRDAILHKPVTIGQGVWVASYSIILPGVTIGDHAVIGAGSVVTKDVPAFELWAGNPAVRIKDVRPQ